MSDPWAGEAPDARDGHQQADEELLSDEAQRQGAGLQPEPFGALK